MQAQSVKMAFSSDRNLLLEQCSRSRGGETVRTKLALRTQKAIRRRSTHGKQLPSALLGDLEMLVSFQRFDNRGKKRDEAFGANAIGRVPDQEQRMLDFWPILSRTWALKCLLRLFCMVEEPPRICTMVSSSFNKGIQQRPFL